MIIETKYAIDLKTAEGTICMNVHYDYTEACQELKKISAEYGHENVSLRAIHWLP